VEIIQLKTLPSLASLSVYGSRGGRKKVDNTPLQAEGQKSAKSTKDYEGFRSRRQFARQQAVFSCRSFHRWVADTNA
jgi:hypothetical protein